MKRRLRLIAGAGLILLTIAFSGVALAEGNNAKVTTQVNTPVVPAGQTAAPKDMTHGHEAAPGAAPGAKAEPQGPRGATALTFTLSAKTDQSAVALAVLTGTDGKPIGRAPVQFSRKTTFGTQNLGTVNTDDKGQAQLDVQTYPGQQVSMRAQFAGNDALAPTVAQAAISVPAAAAQPLDPLLTPRPNPWLVLGLGIVAGGVWFTYGWVYYMVGRLKRAG
ncbi:MAG TPA: hypothetical protein VD969_00035 [Symbiobacteriaceae bacterium]|nr:hypothetical protein [Symbiobacteriaceae bacterium]